MTYHFSFLPSTVEILPILDSIIILLRQEEKERERNIIIDRYIIYTDE